MKFGRRRPGDDPGGPAGSVDRVQTSTRLAHLVASAVLGYPDDELFAKLPLLAEVAGGLPGSTGEPLGRVIRHLEQAGAQSAAEHYVDTFDLRRRCCLYLTYYTHGDTRRRGAALLRFTHAYRAAGVELAEAELPDHLAVVLEFSAAGHTGPAVELLREHRPGLELLWRALDQLRSPYADAIAAVRCTLPAAGASELDAAARLAADGPPAEQVGLAPPPTRDLSAATDLSLTPVPSRSPVPLPAPRLLTVAAPDPADGGTR